MKLVYHSYIIHVNEISNKKKKLLFPLVASCREFVLLFLGIVWDSTLPMLFTFFSNKEVKKMTNNMTF